MFLISIYIKRFRFGILWQKWDVNVTDIIKKKEEKLMIKLNIFFQNVSEINSKVSCNRNQQYKQQYF